MNGVVKSDVRSVAAAEARRCRALDSHDRAVLDCLLADELVHIHSTGRIDSKQSYLAGIGKRIRYVRSERQTYQARLHGDLALANGRLLQVIFRGDDTAPTELRLETSQVWVWLDGEWKLAGYHASSAKA